MLRKLTVLFTALILYSSILIPAGPALASVNGEEARAVQADSYEPDNTWQQAKFITNGTTQTRTITPKEDKDWIKFQVTVQSAVVLETNGPGPSDTRMHLYRHALPEPSEIEVNDDDGPGFYAFIDRECGVDPLPVGTYYIMVEEFLNSSEIPSYNVFMQSNPCPSEVVDIFVGHPLEQQASILVSPNRSVRRNIVGINKGPLKIVNTGGSPFVVTERLLYKAAGGAGTSFSELMALPANQVDTTYWLPWYDNVNLDTQLRIANISGTPATVRVAIGGRAVAGSPFSVPVRTTIRRSFTGINKGPVRILSDVPIVVTERVLYRVNGAETSFSELLALPAKQLDTTYWLPWYNNKTLDTQLRIANISGTPARVNVSIGGVPVAGSPFSVPVGTTIRRVFAGIDRGPVKIVSNVRIVASESVIYRVNNVPISFSEMLAMPNGQLNTVYWLPWYNSVDVDTQLRITNTGGALATVQVYIAGQQPLGSPFTVPANGSVRKSFSRVNKGPVRIVSTENIVVSQRVVFTVNRVPASFSEMMALPDNYLDTVYWLPWYDNVSLDTQLRIGMP